MHRRPRLSLDLLKSFEAAARHVSFTRAAQELFVTQSAVSRGIKTLEEQLGQPLFRRVSRGLELTDAGRTLQHAVGDALRRIEEAVDGLGTPDAPRLTVTTNVPFASLWLAPRLPQFARLHPDVDLRVAASNNVMNLEREHVDLAIRWMPPGAAPERGEHVAVERVLPVCAPALLADPARPLVTPADLAHHVLLQFEPDRMSAPWLDWTQWLEDRAIALAGSAGTVRFSHYDQVIQQRSSAVDPAGRHPRRRGAGAGSAVRPRRGGAGARPGAGRALSVLRGPSPHARTPRRRKDRMSELAALLYEDFDSPLGRLRLVAEGGAFFLVAAADAEERPEVRAFSAWVADELQREAASGAVPRGR